MLWDIVGQDEICPSLQEREISLSPSSDSDQEMHGHARVKSYLSHPESKLDVPYMNFDSLDEIYAMVKFILHFENFDQTSLTG